MIGRLGIGRRGKRLEIGIAPHPADRVVLMANERPVIAVLQIAVLAEAVLVDLAAVDLGVVRLADRADPGGQANRAIGLSDLRADRVAVLRADQADPVEDAPSALLAIVLADLLSGPVLGLAEPISKRAIRKCINSSRPTANSKPRQENFRPGFAGRQLRKRARFARS